MIGGRRLTADEKEIVKSKTLEYKDRYENKFKGAYQKIYPVSENEQKGEKSMQTLQQRYEHLIMCSKEVWGE